MIRCHSWMMNWERSERAPNVPASEPSTKGVVSAFTLTTTLILLFAAFTIFSCFLRSSSRLRCSSRSAIR